jgi:hypothetical protein
LLYGLLVSVEGVVKVAQGFQQSLVVVVVKIHVKFALWSSLTRERGRESEWRVKGCWW